MKNSAESAPPDGELADTVLQRMAQLTELGGNSYKPPHAVHQLAFKSFDFCVSC